MKISVMLRALVPIVFRIAMSRCFSITSRISEATMFSAATMTMSPIVSAMAIFSSVSAEKSAWFICAQSSVKYSGPIVSSMPRATAVARKMSSTLQLDQIDLGLVEDPLGEVERDEAVRAVDLEQAD